MISIESFLLLSIGMFFDAFVLGLGRFRVFGRKPQIEITRHEIRSVINTSGPRVADSGARPLLRLHDISARHLTMGRPPSSIGVME
jgi:hypothetical protein